jgi:hypothetical protein
VAASLIGRFLTHPLRCREMRGFVPGKLGWVDGIDGGTPLAEERCACHDRLLHPVGGTRLKPRGEVQMFEPCQISRVRRIALAGAVSAVDPLPPDTTYRPLPTLPFSAVKAERRGAEARRDAASIVAAAATLRSCKPSGARASRDVRRQEAGAGRRARPASPAAPRGTASPG